MSTTARKEWNVWKDRIAEGLRFRVSVKMFYGKKMTLKYRYITFTGKAQFRAWLMENEANLHSIVNLTNV